MLLLSREKSSLFSAGTTEIGTKRQNSNLENVVFSDAGFTLKLRKIFARN
jgi:hypothetical protein